MAGTSVVWWVGKYHQAEKISTAATGHPRCRILYRGHRIVLIQTEAGNWISEQFVTGMHKWMQGEG